MFASIILLLYLNTRRVCLHNSSCLIFVHVWYKFNLRQKRCHNYRNFLRIHKLIILVYSGSRRKEGIKKRKLGRNPRVPFTQHQVACLEQKFLQMRYLSSVDVAHLAEALCISEDRVRIILVHQRALNNRLF